MPIKLFLDNIPEKYNLSKFMPQAKAALNSLNSGSGAGAEFTGWLDLPFNYDKAEAERVKAAAKKIRGNSKALVVIGIGGSYLGGRAAVDFIKSPNYNHLSKEAPDIFFAGNGLSADSISEIIQMLGSRDFSVNVISKSGTTTEPAIAFRLFRDILVKRYGEKGASERIFATTDKSRGALKAMADKNGYETFVIPDNIGGRYSVLTPVGLLPMAVCGADIDTVLKGAGKMMTLCREGNENTNIALKYAAVRNMLYADKKTVEILSFFEPCFKYFAEWWKQLFGESEGKDGKGILPYIAEYTADLHSMGQYIQQGLRNLFETFIKISNPRENITIPRNTDNTDNLNYLAGKEISYVNDTALAATEQAHKDGGVPNLRIEIDRADEEAFGALTAFFEVSCAISAYMLSVNPFNQPGVEAYKSNMFKLLGKP